MSKIEGLYPIRNLLIYIIIYHSYNFNFILMVINNSVGGASIGAIVINGY